MAISVNHAWANPFTFKQNTITGESFWSGTFSGNDINNNNILETNELNSFDLLLDLDSVSFFLNNLSDFEYVLGSTNLISFSVQKTVALDDELATSREYSLSVNGFVPFSRLSVLTFLGDEPVSIADGASNQPVNVKPVPEPLSLGGILLASFMGTSFKRILKKTKV
ncbi:hypothetical protein PCC7424_0652 [Gloeothece citriformis PCC 7424]|uniref:PEP-CTERM protein-sorting domain-containing protein n=2 Tax=Gloeothece TaxID=28070 RepID=B7KET6_GLOC7|nr:hypothetical protein PCC7424_0652 [Gloeothece citriformis PCC 7424]